MANACLPVLSCHLVVTGEKAPIHSTYPGPSTKSGTHTHTSCTFEASVVPGLDESQFSHLMKAGNNNLTYMFVRIKMQSRMPHPGGSDNKESACNEGNPVQSLGREDPLEKEMATRSSILA